MAKYSVWSIGSDMCSLVHTNLEIEIVEGESKLPSHMSRVPYDWPMGPAEDHGLRHFSLCVMGYEYAREPTHTSPCFLLHNLLIDLALIRHFDES